MAGTVRTRSGLNTEDINVYLNDNTSGDIDPVDHRTSNEDHAISTTNFLDDNFTIDPDGSHKYTADPTGAWDGTAQHDLKFIPKKWLDDVLSTFPTSLENGLNVLGGVGRLGGEFTQNTTLDLYDTGGAVNRDLEIIRNIAGDSYFKLLGSGIWSLGAGASSNNASQVVIGFNAQTTSTGGVVIGNSANGGAGLTVTCIGDNSTVTGTRGISIGYNTSSESGVAIGINANSTGGGNAFGGGSNATATNANAYGVSASATGLDSMAFGYSAIASNTDSLCIGDSNVSGVRAIGIGDGNTVNQTDSIILGSSNSVLGANAYVIGRTAKAGTNGVSIGVGAGGTTGTINSNAVTIGADANGGTGNIGLESTAIGAFVDATATGSIILGRGISGASRLVNSVTDSFGVGFDENTPSFLYSKVGQWLVKSLPTFADDASAGVGGVATDEIYKTATGELRIKL
jgi:hypothetical protein